MIEGLPPRLPDDARLLVLGSMPSEASLRDGAYYAHPRNAFWPIMSDLLGFDRAAAYSARLAALARARIALWDVLAACDRAGSLDSAIVRGSERVNDIAGLLQTHPGITAILLNGGKAKQVFFQRVVPSLSDAAARPQILPMPSTSPAHARMSLTHKTIVWRRALAPFLPDRVG